MPVPHGLEDTVVELHDGWYYAHPLDTDTMQGPYAEMRQCVSDYKDHYKASYF